MKREFITNEKKEEKLKALNSKLFRLRATRPLNEDSPQAEKHEEKIQAVLKEIKELSS